MNKCIDFDYLLMIYQDGRAELIDKSSIACTSYGTYTGIGLPGLEDLIKILKDRGRIEVMDGYNYPADVIREITVQEFRDAEHVYLMNRTQRRSPVTPIERLDIDF